MVENEHLSDKAKHDLVLVEAAKSGKQSAYAELMDRYRDSIYYMMVKMVKNTLVIHLIGISQFICLIIQSVLLLQWIQIV